MTTYPVQCSYAAYHANTVDVEAESLDAALERAIEPANGDPHWKALDHCDPTFLHAVPEGPHADPWSGSRSALPIPDRFTQEGEPPTVTAIMDGGGITDRVAAVGTVRFLVRAH